MWQKVGLLQGQLQKVLQFDIAANPYRWAGKKAVTGIWCPGLACSWENWNPHSPQPVPAPGSGVINLSQWVTFRSTSTAVGRDFK